MSNKGQEYIIDYKTLESGTYEFDYHIDKDFFAMFDEPMAQDGDANVHATMKVSSAGLSIRLDISGTLQVECDRCLEPFDMPIDASYDLVVKYGDKTTPLDEADDVITIGEDDDFLDLSQHIYEYVVLSLPARRVHPDLPDGQPGCDPEMLSHILIADDDEEEYDDEYDDGEEYDDEDGEEYDEEEYDEEEGDEYDEEFADEEAPSDPSEDEDYDDPFAGQELETIEQKLSRDPSWKKIKAKLNNI
ncbi:MAG: DUF177 domain-containing protein [Bacteroidales bacterium]|nr:DUF177 domain-containing protein [Bacteroidales bacterium]